MVKNSDRTYGQNLVEAHRKTDHQEIGETVEGLMPQFVSIIEDAVQKNYENGITGKYYIHIWLRKEPNTPNSLHIYPQCRRTRPSPYQDNDHYLWSVEDGGKIKFEWCIPSKEILKYILANPNQFDKNYVKMLRDFSKDKLETIQDYLVQGKVI